MYVMTLWISIMIISGLSSMLGYSFFSGFSQNVISAITAIAAAAILAMLADTMIPEAFEYAHNFTGLITVLGFLLSFILSKLA